MGKVGFDPNIHVNATCTCTFNLHRYVHEIAFFSAPSPLGAKSLSRIGGGWPATGGDYSMGIHAIDFGSSASGR